MKFNLGRNQSSFDSRDYNLQDFIPKGIFGITIYRNRKWLYTSQPLDQKNTNHCGGFTAANFGINYPTRKAYTEKDGHNFYYMAKEFDGDPKGEGGTTMRSVAKALQKNGNISAYAFAPNMPIIKWWLLNRGPVMVGTIWTEGMFNVKEDMTVEPVGDVVGGHAYLLNEWREDNYIGIQNSWGKNWGYMGKAYISSKNFEKIFSYGGEAITAVEKSTQR